MPQSACLLAQTAEAVLQAAKARNSQHSSYSGCRSRYGSSLLCVSSCSLARSCLPLAAAFLTLHTQHSAKASFHALQRRTERSDSVPVFTGMTRVTYTRSGKAAALGQSTHGTETSVELFGEQGMKAEHARSHRC